MSKTIRYGDQVYIEINNNLSPPATETRLLCSNGFLEETLYGVKSHDPRTTSFRNCIFTITPGLVDSKEDLYILNSLRTELSFLSLHKPDSAGEKYLIDEISSKEKQIELGKDNLDAINKKIFDEMDGKKVSFGDVVLLQHLESGYYLCADSSFHPNNPTLNNLRLKKGRTPACYFKFFSYLGNSERGSIDYECEMKLISTYLNTVVTMGSMKSKLNNFSAENDNSIEESANSLDFPADNIRRENALTSFNTEPLAVGTTLDSQDNNRIKLVEYCSKEDLTAFKKKKIIKNGDYVRFQVDDFYLTVSRSRHRQNFSLAEQKVEGYSHNLINSIFQIVEAEHETAYPKGTELQSVPKNIANAEETDKFYIKHLITGEFLSTPQHQLFAHSHHDQEDKTEEVPFFSLVNNDLKQKTSITKNAKVLLKAFENKKQTGQFYRESDVEEYKPQQHDLNSYYFVGFKNSEDKIKQKLKLLKKSITGNEAGGSIMRVNPVNEDEMKKILEFESYSNAIKNFIKIYQISAKNPQEITPAMFEQELSKMIYCSDKLLSLIANNDIQGQILVREFKILDNVAKLIYYLVLSEEIKSIIFRKVFEMKQMIELLSNFCNILRKATKDELSLIYISQYVRIFILCLVESSPLIEYATQKESEDLKTIIFEVLSEFLEQADVDTFGQLGFYEDSLFQNLDSQKDYSTHLLELLNRYFRRECPNPKIALKENFIKKYVGNPNRIQKIFPKISVILETGQDDFVVEFSRDNKVTAIPFSELESYALGYLNWVFKLISTTGKSGSLKFWSIIRDYYTEELCESLLSSPIIPSKMKTNILSMVKSVHFAYSKLPFDRIPPTIQILLSQPTVDQWLAVFGAKVKEAESQLIGAAELKVTKKTGNKLFQSTGDNINKLSWDILFEGHEQIQKGFLDSFPLALQVMKNLVREEDEDIIKSLWIIHDSLGIFLEKVAWELSTNGKGGQYHTACMKNLDKILFILSEIDRKTVRFALRELADKIKGKVLNHLDSPVQKGSNSHGGVELNLHQEIGISSIIKSVSAKWKSKERLYEVANKPPSSVFTESRLLKSLWKIIESEEGEVTAGFVSLIKDKTDFEAKVTQQLCECAFIAEESELPHFEQLVSSLLSLNQISRRLRLNDEFGYKGQEDKAVLDEIIDHLEKVFLSIYDFESHMAEENQGLTKEQAQQVFLSRFRYSKVKVQNEMPFRHKSFCIKTFYQKIMRMFNAHEILVPFIYHLVDKQALFKKCNDEKFKIGYSLVMAILILFMHKNAANQTLMANYPDFIHIFYMENIFSSSIETIFLFTEMCRENRRLLKLEKDYLFTIAVHSFVTRFDKFRTDTTSPDKINYIRSLPTVISTQLPKDMFDPAKFMTKNLFDYIQFISASNTLSLQKLIDKSSHVKMRNSSKSGTASSWQGDNSELKVIDMPILYIIFKELLESQKIFALTEDKQNVRVLQSSLTLEKILPFFKNENIEFNFELKHLLLQVLENLNFKNVHTNNNIFLDFEQFNSFVSVLFTDVYGYLKSVVPSEDKVFEIFTSRSFSSQENAEYIAKHDKLLETDLNNLSFLQYQSLTIITQIWKKYVYYMICDFFGGLIMNHRNFMLTTTEKGNEESSAFEVWLKLTMKLRELETNPRARVKLDEALKDAVTPSEYAYKRDQVYSALEGTINRPALGLTISPFPRKSMQGLQLDFEFLIKDVSRNQAETKYIYTEENLYSIVLELGLNKPVLKKLIDMLSSTETQTKDAVFVLKLLRKVIEVQNQTKENQLKPIYLWKDVSDNEYDNIAYNQDILNELGIVPALFNMLYEHTTHKRVLKQILLLSIALLFGGNKTIQDEFYAEFEEDIDNEILGSFAQILEETLEKLRIKESQKTRDSYISALQFIFNFLFENKGLNFDKVSGNVKIPENLKESLAVSYQQSRKDSEKEVSIKSDEYDLLLIVLEFLQTLCEGHHFKFQEFLRDQTIVEHASSFNIPEFLRQAYHVYYKYMNIGNIDAGVKILDLLTELQQGASQENVELLLKKTFINDLCNTMNKFNASLDLLSRGFGFDSNHKEFMTLKSKTLVIIKDLVERSEPEALKKLYQYIDLKALASTFKDNILTFNKKRKNVHLHKRSLLTEDIWEPTLSSAFTVYCILKHLSFEEKSEDLAPEIIQAFKEINKDETPLNTEIVNKYLFDFCKAHTGSIEIVDKRLNKLMRIHFPIPAVYSYLKPDTRLEFSNQVDRTNTQTKIADLIDSSTELIGQMYIEYNSRNRLFGLNFNNAYTFIRFLTNLIAIILVGINLFGLVYEDGDVSYRDDEIGAANDALSGFQAFLGVALALLWLQTKLARSLVFKWDDFVSENVKNMGPLPPTIRQKFIQKEPLSKEDGTSILLLKGPYSEEWKYVRHFMQADLTYYNLLFTLKSAGFLWHILYSAICIGSIFHTLVTAFQLFDIVVRSDTVARIASAISRNLSQFCWTVVLLLVTIYVYTLIGFYFLHDRYENEDVGDLCQDAYSCYLASLNQGLRSGGGIADSLQMTEYDPDDKGNYFLETLFDLSNFVIIIILLLNLIFGMIIDAFGDLRDEKTSNEEDKANICFICGIERSEYERSGNFDTHTTEEHNIWEYVAYLVYLFEKEKLLKTDLTDIEDYVIDRYNKRDHAWLPVGRSLTLEHHQIQEERDKGSEIDDLKDHITSSFDRVLEQNKKLMAKVEEVIGYTSQNQLKQSKSAQSNNFLKKSGSK